MGRASNTSIPIGMSSAFITFGRGVFSGSSSSSSSSSSSAFSLCSKLTNNNRTMLELEVLEPLVGPNA